MAIHSLSFNSTIDYFYGILLCLKLGLGNEILQSISYSWQHFIILTVP